MFNRKRVIAIFILVGLAIVCLVLLNFTNLGWNRYTTQTSLMNITFKHPTTYQVATGDSGKFFLVEKCKATDQSTCAVRMEFGPSLYTVNTPAAFEIALSKDAVTSTTYPHTYTPGYVDKKIGQNTVYYFKDLNVETGYTVATVFGGQGNITIRYANEFNTQAEKILATLVLG